MLRKFLPLVACAAMLAQDTTGPTIRTSVREVVVDFVVHDKHGKLVKNLKPEDLTLLQDGAPQKVTSFRLVSGAEIRKADAKQHDVGIKDPGTPLRTINIVCLVFHDLSWDRRKQALEAARQFLASELRPNTYIGVFALDSTGVHPLYRFTNDGRALSAAIERAASSARFAASAGNVFSSLDMEIAQAGTPPTVNQSANQINPLAGAAGGSPLGFGADLGSTMDASTNTGDDASIVANNPLGHLTPDQQRVPAVRELHEMKWLIGQLKPMPFRKTVIMFSSGIARPQSELDYWRDLLVDANAAHVSFYAADITGDNVASPMINARAGMDQTTTLSGGQASASPDAQTAMQRMREPDVRDDAVINGNAEMNLRDLAEGTGGFVVTDLGKKNLSKIMDDVDTHYELTYSPTVMNDGSFHNVSLKLDNASWSVEARPGFFGVPSSAPLTTIDLAGLRALNSKPAPHTFDYRAEPVLFPQLDGQTSATIAFEVPRSSLTISKLSADSHALHVSFYGYLKNEKGEVIEQFSADSPETLPNAKLTDLLGGHLSFTKRMTLPAGRYHLETAVVDWEGGRASTSSTAFVCPERKGPSLSSVVLVRRWENVASGQESDDPLVNKGQRCVPELFEQLPPKSQPWVFFRVYPDKSADKPTLVARLYVNGSLVGEQKSALPDPDASGSVPVQIQAPALPGTDELKLSVVQGTAASVPETVQYSVPAATGQPAARR